MTPEHKGLSDNTIRVLVADSSRIYTRLLADELTRDPLLEVIPFESDVSDLVASAIRDDIDVLVISSTLDEQPSRGLELLRELRAQHPKTRAVLLPDSSKEEAFCKPSKPAPEEFLAGMNRWSSCVNVFAACIRGRSGRAVAIWALH